MSGRYANRGVSDTQIRQISIFGTLAQARAISMVHIRLPPVDGNEIFRVVHRLGVSEPSNAGPNVCLKNANQPSFPRHCARWEMYPPWPLCLCRLPWTVEERARCRILPSSECSAFSLRPYMRRLIALTMVVKTGRRCSLVV